MHFCDFLVRDFGDGLSAVGKYPDRIAVSAACSEWPQIRYKNISIGEIDHTPTPLEIDKRSFVSRKNVKTKGPEARLYHAMFAAILFPAAMFIYAWCTFPFVPWIALVIGITVSTDSALFD